MNNMKGDISRAGNILRGSSYIVAITGAGISRESNVPTFRGEDGLWRNYNAMDLATPQAFSRNPELVWEWYSWRQNLIASCQPNPAHTTLSKWEFLGLLKALITQNVDGLHRRAGSTNVLEVHGNLWSIRCTQCSYGGYLEGPATHIPSCPECDSKLRPDVVWFGEPLNPMIMTSVYTHLEKADVCVVIGTSGIVYPAASFPLVVKQHGGLLIEINTEPTPLTRLVDVHLSGKAGVLLPLLDKTLESQ